MIRLSEDRHFFNPMSSLMAAIIGESSRAFIRMSSRFSRHLCPRLLRRLPSSLTSLSLPVDWYLTRTMSCLCLVQELPVSHHRIKEYGSSDRPLQMSLHQRLIELRSLFCRSAVPKIDGALAVLIFSLHTKLDNTSV